MSGGVFDTQALSRSRSRSKFLLASVISHPSEREWRKVSKSTRKAENSCRRCSSSLILLGTAKTPWSIERNVATPAIEAHTNLPFGSLHKAHPLTAEPDAVIA